MPRRPKIEFAASLVFGASRRNHDVRNRHAPNIDRELSCLLNELIPGCLRLECSFFVKARLMIRHGRNWLVFHFCNVALLVRLSIHRRITLIPLVDSVRNGRIFCRSSIIAFRKSCGLKLLRELNSWHWLFVVSLSCYLGEGYWR